MLRFFRQIRQRLLTENKFSKYLLYAVGEILLVVIGILIALQVNNWNEARLERENEILIARDVYLELLENRVYLSTTQKQWAQRGEHIRALSDTLVTENLQLGQKEFDSLLIRAIYFNSFSLKRKKLDRVLSVGRFEFSASKDLIGEMMNLASLYDSLEEAFKYNQDTWTQVVQPYLIAHYSFRNLNLALYTNDINKSLKISHEPLLVDPVFDNLINNMGGEVRPFNMLLKSSLDKIGELQELLKLNYPNINPD